MTQAFDITDLTADCDPRDPGGDSYRRARASHALLAPFLDTHGRRTLPMRTAQRLVHALHTGQMHATVEQGDALPAGTRLASQVSSWSSLAAHFTGTVWAIAVRLPETVDHFAVLSMTEKGRATLELPAFHAPLYTGRPAGHTTTGTRLSVTEAA